MWSKLTHRNDRKLAKMITEPKDLYGFVDTPGIEVVNLAFTSEDLFWM